MHKIKSLEGISPRFIKASLKLAQSHHKDIIRKGYIKHKRKWAPFNITQKRVMFIFNDV
jgi:hypothetical protein